MFFLKGESEMKPSRKRTKGFLSGSMLFIVFLLSSQQVYPDCTSYEDPFFGALGSFSSGDGNDRYEEFVVWGDYAFVINNEASSNYALEILDISDVEAIHIEATETIAHSLVSICISEDGSLVCLLGAGYLTLIDVEDPSTRMNCIMVVHKSTHQELPALRSPGIMFMFVDQMGLTW